MDPKWQPWDHIIVRIPQALSHTKVQNSPVSKKMNMTHYILPDVVRLCAVCACVALKNTDNNVDQKDTEKNLK